MRIHRIFAAAAVAVMLCSPAVANHYSNLYVIPVVSNVRGSNGTVWMSDVAIQNFQASPLTVQMVFIESGEGLLDNGFPLITDDINGSVTVPPGGSVLLRDVLRTYRRMTNPIGSLIVAADLPFAVTSRAYSMSPSGDTIGQTVRPSANFLNVTEGSVAPASAYIPGLIHNAQFRSNLGMVAANATGFNSVLSVLVTLRNAAGTTIGTKQFDIGPGSFTHLQFSVRDITTANFDIGSAEFRIVQGSGSVVPYGSVVDNRTADAVFILGQFPDNSSMNGNALFPRSAFHSLLQRFSTR